MLTFAPLESKSFNKSFGSFEPSVSPVKCYYTKDGKVHLPYRFACALTKKVHNMGEYEKLYTGDLEFKGKTLNSISCLSYSFVSNALYSVPSIESSTTIGSRTLSLIFVKVKSRRLKNWHSGTSWKGGPPP